MGKDIVAGGRYVGHKNRKSPESENVYIKLLVKLYEFLARRTGAGMPKVVHKRLMMSKNNRPPVGLNRLIRYMASSPGKIAVVVGSITDDVRLEGHNMPALRVCALRFSETARARILKAGGEILTFDQLALASPTGTDTVLIRGRRTARKAYRYFGTPSTKRTDGTKPRPFVRSKGRNFEKARGRRNSRGFRV
eukprot:CAMPEP_0185568346 /NCGR_PEP_ID=MMETSP0434-20130131/1333_1 /TAXON_ID=626734 ORGANISM="Favella taraikaensis, Strain Fe Narragansett Bay" /NCGR_SAMPLE_ID=MMETSP0434 /ASSEMBLY_ACC=CAM_ASM_000379 /LENGTH=192 /DNA_ID=CAMNT_0028182833 /DNA_START=25 /DNA_END=603 /DNA_ORIENTATION=-